MGKDSGARCLSFLETGSIMFIPDRYTVESVTSGHPDKVCDQISDAILDACLTADPMSRVAVEAFGSHGHLTIGGEITTTGKVDYAAVAMDVYRRLGYREPLEIRINIVAQSPDIAQGVDGGGAGDQGIMYGYATDETPELLPRGVVLSHRLARHLETKRRDDPQSAWLRPDGKTQVTIERGRVTAIVVSAQHDEAVTIDEVRQRLTHDLVAPVIGDLTDVHVYVNPAGPWHLGGFAADTGLTGRKIMVDSYGGIVPHGGGCFSGKDGTKVDRSGAYMARLAAATLVAEGRARQILVSVAYAIGQSEPVMLWACDEADRDRTGDIRRDFDFRPNAIIERLGLRRPIFQTTAAYGHFGRAEFSWEPRRR